MAANLVRRGDDVDADHLLGQHRLGVDAAEPRAEFNVLGHSLKKKRELKFLREFICHVEEGKTDACVPEKPLSKNNLPLIRS